MKHSLLLMPFIVAFVFYLLAYFRKRGWPVYRLVFWGLGILCSLGAMFGPLAEKAQVDFTYHMITHLLLGMLAPLLLALAAPMTLALGTLPVGIARRISGPLRSWPLGLFSDPFVASLLNIGGLWILYTTELYQMMHGNMVLHLLIHLHVFLAGYLFTIAIVYIDPMPHRRSFSYRVIVLVISLAGHNILAKWIYAHPPFGVPRTEAELGGLWMYYGGDAIDLILIILFFHQWYRATRPRYSTVNNYQL